MWLSFAEPQLSTVRVLTHNPYNNHMTRVLILEIIKLGQRVIKQLAQYFYKLNFLFVTMWVIYMTYIINNLGEGFQGKKFPKIDNYIFVD